MASPSTVIHEVPPRDAPRTSVASGVRILPGAMIGANCSFGEGAYVEGATQLGDRVNVGAGAKICDGVVVHEGVSIGPGTVLDGGRGAGRAKASITVHRGVNLGANVTVQAGVTLGHGALIESGSVVTADVPPFTVARGNPARVSGIASPTGPVGVRSHNSPGALPGGAKFIKVPGIDHPTGLLSFLEERSGLPFVPQRYFTLTRVPDSVVRARHAHKACHQYFACLHGSVRLGLDDGVERADVELTGAMQGLVVFGGVWVTVFGHTFDTVLLVLASQPYDESDYLRDYDGFLRFKGL